jgi:hypothetical protein
MSGVDIDRCRFGLETPDSPAPAPVAYDGRYYLREGWQALRKGGLPALARKVLDELDRRHGQPVPQCIPTEVVSQQQISHWVQQAHIAAANDVIEAYPGLMEKRAYIQQHRRRTDRDIFESVRALSFDVCFDTPEYRQAQQRLIEMFGIKKLFGEVFDPNIPFVLRISGDESVENK